MKSTIIRTTFLSCAMAGSLAAQSTPAAANDGLSPATKAPSEKTEKAPQKKQSAAEKKQAAMKEEQERLALENALMDERVKKETAKMRAEAARLKAEKELIAERLAHAAVKRKAEEEARNAKLEIEKDRLAREATIAKAKAEVLGSELKALQAQYGIELTKLENQMKEIETAKKRSAYANAKPEYLDKPLRDDGTLIISDRRIALNGPISGTTADYVTDRIHFYNNADGKKPIFIVIDESPGGSVMAGYRIVKAMEASSAPVYVVVKSFAASMAAAITTLAEDSFAYPNAVILHHQISMSLYGRLNLKQQEELLADSNRWWKRFGTPIADKMGITKEEFIKRMYEHSSSGDWTEFGEEAKKLKWVNHIVNGIQESSFLRNPDAETTSTSTTPKPRTGKIEVDAEGRDYMLLPRLNPKDVYFLYNPDGYYRLR
ncbi:MAG: ATP-dependent Clp protease proteolytic subunit [Verrucomicrobiales bacterium]